MGTLVVGDVHGCADELERLIALVQPSRTVLVGDLFTKGPDPAGVWALIQEHRIEAVLGNHDERLLRYLQGDRPRDLHAREVARSLDVDRRWRDWLAQLPLFREVGPFTVVHAGLHPSGSLAMTTRAMALTMRRWPLDDPKAPRWGRVYQGERRVIFGHDAVAGIQRHERKGLPFCIGLDSGCVYGKRLTGYLVEDDEQIGVDAARVYCPMK